MNTSESIDLLSDVLLDDERIVTSGEREFLAELLRRSENNPQESNPGITRTIARIAGEIVVQRAGNLVGETILRRWTENLSGHGQHRRNDYRVEEITQFHTASLPPKPPGPVPPNPGPTPGGYMAAARKMETSSLPPKPPGPVPPNPGPGPGMRSTVGPKGILNLTEPVHSESLPPKCVVLEEFLMPAELNDLLSYTLSHQGDFILSEVISPGIATGSAVDFEYRRSHVLLDIGPYYERLLGRLQSVLPRLLLRLGIEPFPVSKVEAQITASKDGDFFRWHNDNGLHEVALRRITFVYFFHREPKAFEGGELRIQSPSPAHASASSENYYTIVPRQNQLVLFDSSLTHEIAPVKCTSEKFADSRFTVNGWICR